jgi:hypothetical protein
MGVGSWDFDVAASRVFRFQETKRIEFRVEAFNVLNSFRPMNPSLSVSGSTFGLIRNAQAPRVMQFALKYVF